MSSAIGSAAANPTSITTSWNEFTQAVPSRPPAAKYTVMMPPPMSEPSQRGAPVMTLRMAAPAISCAARIHRQPNVTRTELMPRTVGP